MVSFRQRGDSLADFVLASNRAGMFATEDTVRLTARAAGAELKRQIRQRFGSSGRVFNSRGFAAAILVRKQDVDWWQVIDRSLYSKKRSQPVSLAWVYDTAPVVKGKKDWVAVPIRGQAPLASSGRRYAWPSEAARMGWELEIVAIMGKPFKLIMGRRNRIEGWRPLYYYIPPYRAAKRLDLDGLHRKHFQRMELLWVDRFDNRVQRLKRAA